MSRPNTPTYKTLNWPAYNKALRRLFDPELDAVRKLGELLKGFIEARTIVINTILAERQIQILRRR